MLWSARLAADPSGRSVKGTTAAPQQSPTARCALVAKGVGGNDSQMKGSRSCRRRRASLRNKCGPTTEESGRWTADRQRALLRHKQATGRAVKLGVQLCGQRPLRGRQAQRAALQQVRQIIQQGCVMSDSEICGIRPEQLKDMAAPRGRAKAAPLFDKTRAELVLARTPVLTTCTARVHWQFVRHAHHCSYAQAQSTSRMTFCPGT